MIFRASLSVTLLSLTSYANSSTSYPNNFFSPWNSAYDMPPDWLLRRVLIVQFRNAGGTELGALHTRHPAWSPFAPEAKSDRLT
jgi:hypothetical protein